MLISIQFIKTILRSLILTMEISSDKMAVYRSTARQRQATKEQRLTNKYQQAWKVSRRAAQILKEKFGAGQVAVFGSLLSISRFHHHSDIDLAVWGLDEKVYYRAVACLLDLDPTISIDLVEVQLAPPALQENIKNNGVLL